MAAPGYREIPQSENWFTGKVTFPELSATAVCAESHLPVPASKVEIFSFSPATAPASTVTDPPGTPAVAAPSEMSR